MKISETVTKTITIGRAELLAVLRKVAADIPEGAYITAEIRPREGVSEVQAIQVSWTQAVK